MPKEAEPLASAPVPLEGASVDTPGPVAAGAPVLASPWVAAWAFIVATAESVGACAGPLASDSSETLGRRQALAPMSANHTPSQLCARDSRRCRNQGCEVMQSVTLRYDEWGGNPGAAVAMTTASTMDTPRTPSSANASPASLLVRVSSGWTMSLSMMSAWSGLFRYHSTSTAVGTITARLCARAVASTSRICRS